MARRLTTGRVAPKGVGPRERGLLRSALRVQHRRGRPDVQPGGGAASDATARAVHCQDGAEDVRGLQAGAAAGADCPRARAGATGGAAAHAQHPGRLRPRGGGAGGLAPGGRGVMTRSMVGTWVTAGLTVAHLVATVVFLTDRNG